MSNQKEGFLNNILLSIIIPAIILSKFSKEEYLGPFYGLIIALLFPLVYGLYGFFKQKRKNYIAVIGFIGILFSGIVGLLKFPPHWIAVKEASVPLIIGIIILISTKTKWQLVNKIIYNKSLLDIDKIEERLDTEASKERLNTMLFRSNIFLAATFFVSATLNYILAKIIVKSMPGTVMFNEELGRMAILSFPVIAIPLMIIMSFIFMYILSKLKKLTQLSNDELFNPKTTS
jgi:hypothetical protein